MRLLILNYEYPPLGGGAGRCTRFQAEGLAALGHEVTVITTWFEGEPELEERERFTLVRLKSMREKAFRSNPLEMTSWARHAYRYIVQNGVQGKTDLVLAHFSLPGGMVALPLNLKYRLPYFIISHGQDIPWFSPRELFFYHLAFYVPIRWICSRASGVTVLSEQRLRELHRLTSKKHHSRQHIIPNGCDIAFFTPSEDGKDRNRLRMLFVGRLTRQKDPFALLRAVRILADSGVPFSLDIVGDGPLRQKMHSFIESHQLQGSVAFSGWVSRDELREKYRVSNLMIMTSRDEGQSLAMMEALASGLYLFTTPVSGSGSLIREGINGEYIPVNKSRDIAAKLAAFYEGKVTKSYRIPEKLVQETRNSIGWDHYVQAYAQILPS